MNAFSIPVLSLLLGLISPAANHSVVDLSVADPSISDRSIGDTSLIDAHENNDFSVVLTKAHRADRNILKKIALAKGLMADIPYCFPTLEHALCSAELILAPTDDYDTFATLLNALGPLCPTTKLLIHSSMVIKSTEKTREIINIVAKNLIAAALLQGTGLLLHYFPLKNIYKKESSDYMIAKLLLLTVQNIFLIIGVYKLKNTYDEITKEVDRTSVLNSMLTLLEQHPTKDEYMVNILTKLLDANEFNDAHTFAQDNQIVIKNLSDEQRIELITHVNRAHGRISQHAKDLQFDNEADQQRLLSKLMQLINQADA
jgi:hypothetical protein